MVYSFDDLKRIVSPIAKKHNLKAVYLFGSYARGEAAEDSDVDLLVDLSGTQIRGLFALGGLYAELEEALGKRIDLITVGALEQPPRMPSEASFRDTVKKERVNLYAVA